MRKVLITGASGGIGAAVAVAFAKCGDEVYLGYRTHKAEAEALAGKIGAVAVSADVSDSAQVQQMAEQIGDVDILVNNAGISRFALLDTVSDEEWNEILSVNLSGAFYCIRAFLPGMIHKKRGCIINVSSIWGICGASCEVAYSASKAGLIGLTKALAKEVGPSGIRVNCVAPGVIDTPMNHNLSEETLFNLREETPLGRIGTPEDIAKTILFLTEDDSFLTGQIISPNGGLVI